MQPRTSLSRSSYGSSIFVELSRAQAELASFAAALPQLGRAPKGDAHPVLVLPGLLAGDESTLPFAGSYATADMTAMAGASESTMDQTRRRR